MKAGRTRRTTAVSCQRRGHGLPLLGTSVPRTPDGNVRVGVALLSHLLHAFRGNERLALAAYYQGERSVRARGVLPMSELYVDDILALKSRV